MIRFTWFCLVGHTSQIIANQLSNNVFDLILIMVYYYLYGWKAEGKKVLQKCFLIIL